MSIENCKTQKLVDDLMRTHTWVGPVTKFVWEKKKHLKSHIGSQACTVIQTISKTLCRLGVFTPYNVWERLNAYEEFEDKSNKTAPPTWATTRIKTRTKTFNHINYYALKDGLVFFKPIKTDLSPWSPMYIPPGVPVKIDCDGANFSVEISYHKKVTTLFTKKVLTEWRSKKTKKYKCLDLTEKDNWRESWFNIPVVSALLKLPFINFIACFPSSRRLINNGSYDLMISHCGVKHRYYIDPSEKKHEYRYGVTQVAALETKTACPKIYYADPWLPFKLSYSHDLPSDFIARGASMSASTLFLIGHETQNRSKLVLYLKMIDYDIKGFNPFYWLMNYYTYKTDCKNPRKIALPPRDWKKVELPEFDANVRISKLINIIQNGEGNDARLLNIRVMKNGVSGCYSKHLLDPKWEFFETPDDEIEEESFLKEITYL